MAKAKKSVPTSGENQGKSQALPAGKKAAAAAKSPTAAKKSHPATAKSSATMPGINTSLAAESAAKFLAAGINLKKPQTGGSSKPESALFKQLKSGLNKPASGAMNNLLDKTHGPSATKQHEFAKQVGRNQTIGSDAARTGVPRRTNG